MPFLTIAFPVFDPIALSIGPTAIRWYALAYIGGIVLGWIYARSLVKNEKLWGGPAPITTSTAARFSASFTDASRTTRISARLLQPKPSPPPAEFPPPLEFSPPRGSTQISTCGLATPKTSRHGNYFGTPAKPTLGPLRLANKEERTPPPKPLSWKPANRFWPQRAATGAGGSAQSTAPRTTPSSTPSIGST